MVSQSKYNLVLISAIIALLVILVFVVCAFFGAVVVDDMSIRHTDSRGNDIVHTANGQIVDPTRSDFDIQGYKDYWSGLGYSFGDHGFWPPEYEEYRAVVESL